MLKVKNFLFLLVLFSQKIIMTADGAEQARPQFSYFPMKQSDVQGVIAIVKKSLFTNDSNNDSNNKIIIANPYDIQNTHLPEHIQPDYYVHVVNISSETDLQRLVGLVSTRQEKIFKYYPAGQFRTSNSEELFTVREPYSVHLLNPENRGNIRLNENMYTNVSGQPQQGSVFIQANSNKSIIVARFSPNFIESLDFGNSSINRQLREAMEERQKEAEARKRKLMIASGLGVVGAFAAFDVAHEGAITKSIASALKVSSKFCYQKIVVPYAKCSSYLIKNSFWYWYGKPLTMIGKPLLPLVNLASKIPEKLLISGLIITGVSCILSAEIEAQSYAARLRGLLNMRHQ